MTKANTRSLLSVLAGLAVSSAASAASIDVTADVTVSATWTKNNVYNLTKQIYVRPGATLTIEAGTIVATKPNTAVPPAATNGGGSLAVCRGAQIFVLGTETEPVIMTSTADVATWSPLAGTSTGKNPQSGTWHAGHNEWGNITVMGQAFIGAGPPKYASNSSTCNVNNVAAMEGLVAAFPGDPDVLYGGNQDNDDSGTIQYVSLRYGGKVIGLANELNGLSMGGVGRATDVHHIEIMNNIDDGIETWGGTVNYKYINIWNVGDDSFDVDQGWRGKAQFMLIVQGYSDASATVQGSGIGDQCFEVDGAEDSDAQPVTTATIYNATAIGQPNAGRNGTAWRDGARVQYRNCIFMDLGQRLVRNQNSDGDAIAGSGYGFNGTTSFCNIWTTPYTTTSTVNPCNNPSQRYQAQSAGNAAIGQGFLAEITDSVFFRNQFATGAYSDGTAAYACDVGANTLGVTVAGGSAPLKGNVVPRLANMPIAGLTRGPNVTLGSFVEVPVISIDPRAAHDAVTSVSAAPNDGFFTPANYRGAFGSTSNWLCGWTAVAAYGWNVAPPGGCTPKCAGNVNGDLVVDVNDLLPVINAWGACPNCPPNECAADLNGDCQINVNDLLAVINHWGACP